MDLILYKNNSVFNKVNKSLDRVSSLYDVVNVDDTNDQTISLRYTGTYSVNPYNANYMKWDNIFYFITSVDTPANGVMMINGEIDVLMTYRHEISEAKVKLARSSNLGNAYVEDPERVFTSNEIRSIKELDRKSVV